MHRRQGSQLAIRPSKHTGKRKKPVCGDSRHDLNYPEIPDSWNNKEKTTMRENETKENQGKFTDACDALNQGKDHERVIVIREAEIRSVSSAEINLFNVLCAKGDVEQLLATECEKAHRIACEGKSEDECHAAMKELVMIIVNRYGGAISANTLQRLLGKCKELEWAVVSLIAGGRLSAVSHTDGSPACFYVPTICNKNCQFN